MIKIADNINEIPFSGIRRFFDMANEIEGVISLGVGEPDFDTPWNIREEAIYALEKGRTVYTSNAGLYDLRVEISNFFKNKLGLSYSPRNQILVTVGASEAIDIALRSVLNSGDEALVPEPCFVSYRPCVTMAGGIPTTISLSAENNFKLTKKQVLSKITDRTKAIIINYPNNPTGAIMENDDLEELAKVFRERDILVISDEIYSELTYSKKGHASIASFDGMYEKTVVINGFSKSHAMTGWRLGYAVGPPEIISAMTKIHQYIIMCAPTMSQYAGIEALKNGSDNVEAMCKSYDARRRLMLNGFENMGLDCFEPLGAFYTFPCIKSTGFTSEEFCEKLLKTEKVAVVPGSAFGESGEGYVRCSYAYSLDTLKEAMSRIGRFVQSVV